MLLLLLLRLWWANPLDIAKSGNDASVTPGTEGAEGVVVWVTPGTTGGGGGSSSGDKAVTPDTKGGGGGAVAVTGIAVVLASGP